MVAATKKRRKRHPYWIKHSRNQSPVCTEQLVWTHSDSKFRVAFLWVQQVFNTLPFHFPPSVYSLPLCAFPSFYPQGYRTRLWCSRGEVKALCTACQITFLMTSLSGFFISEKRKKKRGGGWGGGFHSSLLFLVTAKSLIRFFILYLFLKKKKKSFLSSWAFQVFWFRIQMVVITWQIEIKMWGENRCIVGLSAACPRSPALIVFRLVNHHSQERSGGQEAL